MVMGWKRSILSPLAIPYTLTIAASSHVFDTNTDRCGFIFASETASAITDIGFRQTSVTGSPGVLRASLQGVDSSGLPDGTVKGGGSPASVTFTPTGADDGKFVWKTLANSYTPSAIGELLAIVIDRSSGTFDPSNSVQIATNLGFNGNLLLPYAVTDGGAGIFSRVASSVFGYRTASTYHGPIHANCTESTVTTSGHRRALYFTFNGEGVASYSLRSAYMHVDAPAAGNIKYGLWQGTTLLDSYTIAGTASAQAVVARFAQWLLTTNTLIVPGTKYYLGIEADGNAMDLSQLEFTSVNDKAAFMDDTASMGLATFDGSSWTEDDTKVPLVYPVIQSVTPGGGLGLVIGG